MIRDRIVIGIINDKTIDNLLEEKDLDLQKCLNICRAGETTQSQIKEMASSSVHQIGQGSKAPKKNLLNTNLFINLINYKHPLLHAGDVVGITRRMNVQQFVKNAANVTKSGIIKKMCRSKRKVNMVSLHIQEDSEDDEYPAMIGSLRDAKVSNDWNVNVLLDGKEVIFKIDTGVALTIIPLAKVPKKVIIEKTSKTPRPRK
ncbi:Pol polyprotein [Elysia marginata]|uniref:Pol polyprotein n=1 Tax=Elysia marginata TaxID=1093978 RepID=A0AAV4IBS7_9GAST|nr:Pol polyprotein [Elysia marginata]